MSVRNSRYWLMLLALLLSFSGARGDIYYVDGGAGDDGRAGTGGWSDALKTITNALAKASAPSEIWVKSGTYKPSDDNDRTKSFAMKNGVDLYGGFDGTETSRDQRDWSANQTVLSGELGSPDTLLDNSRHVVVGATARLDGFTVCNGCASNSYNGSDLNNYGAGMYTSGAFPVVANCVFSNNLTICGAGGAVYWSQGGYTTGTSGWYNCVFDGNMSSNSWSYTPGLHLNLYTNIVGGISNCTFRRNRGFIDGGALRLVDYGKRYWPEGSAFRVQSCVFSNNLDYSGYAGGVNVSGFVAPVYFEDCLFIGNTNICGTSGGGGGAMTIGMSATGQGLRMYRCVFDRNYSSKSGAVALCNGGGTNSIWRHCVFRNNSAGKYGGVFYGAVDGTFESCVSTNNTAYSSTSGGGALYISSVGHTAVDRYTDCKFYDSRTGLNGGIVSLTAGAAEFRGCDFVNGQSGPWGVGGALVYWSGTGDSAGLFDNCLFANGKITSAAGAAGALYHAGGGLTLTNCRFVASTAKSDGGAIYSSAGLAPFATGCHFVSNTIGTAKGFGGAWYARGPARIERCVFDGNRATSGRGGALCVRDVTTATGVVANCVFRDNIGYYGGAIATTNAHLRLSHVTAYTNSSLNAAHGGALSHDGTGTPLDGLVDNSIFWGNGATEILPAEGVACRYSDVAGGFAGEGNRNADPRFADARYLHLSSRTSVYTGGYFNGGAWQVSPAHSPLIDAGDPADAWSLEPVPNNGRVNMGAYGNTSVASLSLRGGTLLLVK